MEKTENKKGKSGEELQLSRRNLFTLAGWGALLAYFATSAIASLRFMFPNIVYERSLKVKLGQISDYAIGSTTFNDSERVFIIRNQEGIKTISAICTHLGCTVNWSEKNNRFECPCHGSKFNTEGKVVSGPAPKALDWLEVKASPNKRLVVNKGKKVDKDYILKV